MNVRWVDGFENNIDEDEFVKDYIAEELTVKDMLSKYGLSIHRFQKIRNELTDYRRKGKNNGKYYCYIKKHKKYDVYKFINQKRVYYGRYKTEEEAQSIVREMQKINWDKTQLPYVKEKLKIEE